MESGKKAGGGKLKLNCSVRLKPCGMSIPGCTYQDNLVNVGGTLLGPFTSIIGPNDGQERT